MLLLIAVQHKQYRVAQLLLEHGCEISGTDDDGNTPLMCSASDNEVEIVQMLLHRGAIVDERDRDGKTALMCAAEKGNSTVVKILLDKGANANACTVGRGITPLIYAASNESEKCMKYLLQHGADINDETEAGGPGTALMSAVEERNLAAVQYLLSRGANPNVTVLPIVIHSKPISPLQFAHDSNCREIADALENAGAQK